MPHPHTTTEAASGAAVAWAERTAACGRCGTHLAHDASRCPACGDSTGPFTPVVTTAHLVGRTLQIRTPGQSLRRRELTEEQARWVARSTSRPDTGEVWR